MVRWEVRSPDKTAVVNGTNWFAAIGAAAGPLQVEPMALARLVCDIQPDGLVVVRDPRSSLQLLVRRLPADGADARPAARVSVPPPPPDIVGAVPATARTEAARPFPVGAPPPRPASASQSVLDMALFAARTLSDEPTEEARPQPVPAPLPPVAEEDEPLLFVVPPELQALDAPEPPGISMPEPSIRPEPLVEPEPEPEAAPEPVELEEFEEESLVAPVPPVVESPDGFTEADLAFFGSYVPQGDALGPPPDLAETLFERCVQVTSCGTIDEAADAALTILREYVPAESGAVLYAGINDTALRFIGAHGPYAEEVRALQVPLGQGIAGMCFDLGASVIIRDAHSDPRHLVGVDEATGYRTRDLLAAVIRDDEGIIYGCIELLNPPVRFHDWHLDAAQSVAKALGDHIRLHA